MPTTFKEFLTLLVGLGPTLKKVWPQIVLIYQTVVAIIGEFKQTPDTVSVMSAEEIELCVKVQQILNDGEAAVAHGITSVTDTLRIIWSLMEKYPALAKLLIGLLTSVA